MDALTLTALQQSIDRWEVLSQASDPDQVRLGDRRCPLCVLFMDADFGPNCRRCPVFHRTTEVQCKGTPYQLAAGALRNWRGAKYYCRTPWAACRDEFQAAARAEAEFLRSLLPPDAGG